ncbi:MAG: hypothetical protein WC955_06715 [Elusimicrobiota bacterium]
MSDISTNFLVSAPVPVNKITAGNADVLVYNNPDDMGLATAISIAKKQVELVGKNGYTSIMIMAAPAAFPFYRAYVGLAKVSKDLQAAIRKTLFFQFDDYPLPAHHPATFRFLLAQHLYIPLADYINPGNVYPFNVDAKDAAAECRRYTKLVLSYGPDLQVKGQGEDSHWGFHQPGMKLKTVPAYVKIGLNKMNTAQQMRDHPGMFPTAKSVPTVAYSANVALFMKTRMLLEDNVPQASKAFALLASFGNNSIDDICPSGQLKTHKHAVARTTSAAAWALLEYRRKKIVTRESMKKLDNIWYTENDPEVTESKRAFMRSAFKKLKIKYEDYL